MWRSVIDRRFQVVLGRLVALVSYDWCVDRLRLQVSPQLSSGIPYTDCFSSVKWVGFFVTALVGAYTIEDLWNKFGDLRLTYVSLVSLAL